MGGSSSSAAQTADEIVTNSVHALTNPTIHTLTNAAAYRISQMDGIRDTDYGRRLGQNAAYEINSRYANSNSSIGYPFQTSFNSNYGGCSPSLAPPSFNTFGSFSGNASSLPTLPSSYNFNLH